MPGRLIVVEGLDGVGKTTLSRNLARALGASWMTTPDSALRPYREPFDRAYAQDPDCSKLFYAAAVLSAAREAERRLAVGDVVMDRYWSSTLAYSQKSRLRLDEVEALLPRAHQTLVVELEESERWRRLEARGATMLDWQTAGERGQQIARLLRAEGCWSGLVSRLPVDGLDEEAAVTAALRLLEGSSALRQAA